MLALRDLEAATHHHDRNSNLGQRAAARAGPVRIAVVATGSPRNRRAWSGTPWSIVRELERRFGDIEIIDTAWIDRLISKTYVLRRFGILSEREPLVSHYFARFIDRCLARLRPDVLVVIAAEPKVSSLQSDVPIVFISDSFFRNILNYYDTYRNVGDRVQKIGDQQQRRLLSRGATILLSSHWAAATAAADYGQPLGRFEVAPFGANFDHDPLAGAHPGASGPLKLLFVGYDWVRKGGEIVLEAFEHIRRRRPDAELHIVGCHPPATEGVAGVVRHGVLDKRSPTEGQRLEGLFRDAAFFFMPTRREAYGLVYAEACAFGLPPVATDTGGVGTIVRHGVNGLLLPPEAGASAYATAILDLWADPAAYGAMRHAAREAYETRLNWRAWGDIAERVIREAARKSA